MVGGLKAQGTELGETEKVSLRSGNIRRGMQAEEEFAGVWRGKAFDRSTEKTQLLDAFD